MRSGRLGLLDATTGSFRSGGATVARALHAAFALSEPLTLPPIARPGKNRLRVRFAPGGKIGRGVRSRHMRLARIATPPVVWEEAYAPDTVWAPP
jgi:hypothetical protein